MKITITLLALLFIAHIKNFALTPQEEKLIDRTKKLNRKWLAISTGTIGEKKEQVDEATFAKIEKENHKAIIDLVSKSLEVKNFEDGDSLWNTILQEPYFNANVVLRTIQLISKKDFPPKRREKILDIIIESVIQPKMKSLAPINIRSFLFVANTDDFFTPEQRTKIVKLMLKYKETPLLYYGAFLIRKKTSIEVQKYIEKNALKFDNSFRGGTSLKSWLSLCMLAEQGNREAIDKIKKITPKVLSSKNTTAINYIPYGLAYTKQPELINMIFPMLRSDTIIVNGEDAVPDKTQLAHVAASALGAIIADFPQYGFYQSFSEDDKKKCEEWSQKHRGNYKIINRSWKYFYLKTILGLI